MTLVQAAKFKQANDNTGGECRNITIEVCTAKGAVAEQSISKQAEIQSMGCIVDCGLEFREWEGKDMRIEFSRLFI